VLACDGAGGGAERRELTISNAQRQDFAGKAELAGAPPDERRAPELDLSFFTSKPCQTKLSQKEVVDIRHCHGRYTLVLLGD
jgi:hypothetical protein